MFSRDIKQGLITGVSLIFLFLSLQGSPVGNFFQNNWMIGIVISLMLFAFSPSIADKI